MRGSRLAIYGLVMVAALISGGWLMQRGASAGNETYRSARRFEDVVARIAEFGLDSLDERRLYEMAVDALIEELSVPLE